VIYGGIFLYFLCDEQNLKISVVRFETYLGALVMERSTFECMILCALIYSLCFTACRLVTVFGLLCDG
jgi:hypothetical protein